MDSTKISEIIRNGENFTVEFKQGFGDEVIIALNAFANTRGSLVLVGISDKCKIVGIKIGAETIREYINRIKQKTEPSIIPDVEVLSLENKNILVFSVKEFPAKPVSMKGRYYKRIGNSNHLLTLPEVTDIS